MYATCPEDIICSRSYRSFYNPFPVGFTVPAISVGEPRNSVRSPQSHEGHIIDWKRSLLKLTFQPTALKTNMFSENQWLEDIFPTEIVVFFFGDMLVFGGVFSKNALTSLGPCLPLPRPGCFPGR